MAGADRANAPLPRSDPGASASKIGRRHPTIGASPAIIRL
jgi:hypothetical protein